MLPSFVCRVTSLHATRDNPHSVNLGSVPFPFQPFAIANKGKHFLKIKSAKLGGVSLFCGNLSVFSQSAATATWWRSQRIVLKDLCNCSFYQCKRAGRLLCHLFFLQWKRRNNRGVEWMSQLGRRSVLSHSQGWAWDRTGHIVCC